jgi:hypothetical protein
MNFFDRIGIALSLLCPLIGLAIFAVALVGGLIAYQNLQAALEHAAAVLPR